MYTIKVNENQYADLARVLSPKTLQRIQVSALSELARSGKKLIADEVREVLNIKASTAKDAVIAVVQKDTGTPKLTFTISKKLPRVEDFTGTRITSAGVSFSGIKGRSPQLILHAFRAKVKAGSKTKGISVVRAAPPWLKSAKGRTLNGRKIKAGTTPKGVAWGLPIRNLYGTSIYELLVAAGGLSRIGNIVLNNLAGRYEERSASKAEYELNRVGAD